MSAKISEQEMINRLNKVTNNQEVCKYISGYSGMKKKCVFQCQCGKQFPRTPKDLINQKRLTCGHCNDFQVGDKFNKLTITKIISNQRGGGCKVICKCNCGNVIGPILQCHIKSGNTKSCGYCNAPKIGDKIYNFIIKEIIPSPANGCSVKVQCKCGTFVIRRWAQIKKGNIKSCGHCNDPKIGDKFNRLTITKVIPNKYGGGGCQVVCKCDCGNMWGPAMFKYISSGNTSSCGHCNNPKIGDKFGKLTVIKILPGKTIGCRVKCICDCGNIWGPNEFKYISKGNTSSCGHCNDPKIGDKFGKLTVIEVIPNNNGSCRVRCQCDCGRIRKPISPYYVISNHTTSCGHCLNMRNGRLTSLVALKLNEVTDEILNQTGLHNHDLPNKLGNVDIFYPKENLVIEYNGAYYHYNNKKIDNKKYSKIMKNGYKLFIIRAGGNIQDIPKKKRLEKILLNDFRHGSKRKTITLNSWYDNIDRIKTQNSP